MSNFTPTSIADFDVSDIRIAIVTAEWNSHITSKLRDGATATLKERGLKKNQVDLYQVPGTVELTFAASQLIESEAYDAIIIIGVVIKGDTPHFDYVCQSVTQGMTALNADCDTPVIFGVLTVLDEQQALDRAGGAVGNKGSEAADTALKMVQFKRITSQL
ncbi:MAG: 6,7-dimethyl-8-ribityllumazine synthase [Muribaculaceae bacterium]|nr:6,7-dimethyl-8-ribityllumazine synthase [Muribaculaceae bacterium]